MNHGTAAGMNWRCTPLSVDVWYYNQIQLYNLLPFYEMDLNVMNLVAISFKKKYVWAAPVFWIRSVTRADGARALI